MREKIAEFFGKIKGLYTNEETKKKALIITIAAGAVIAVVIAIIAANAFLNGFSGDKDKDDVLT